MSTTARVKINIHEGMIELEGSEDFVTRYLNEFKELINHKGTPHSQKNVGEAKTTLEKKRVKGRVPHNKSSKAPKVDIEEFETKKEKNKPSLAEFFESKKAQRDEGFARIAAIAYYITHYAKINEFSEGHIEYAFEVLGLRNRPTHLRQALTDIKNKKKWLDVATEGKFTLSRRGKLYVEEKLPPNENK